MQPESLKISSSPQICTADERTEQRLAYAVVVLAGILALFPLLGLVEIFNVGEGREGMVVNEILDSGNIVLPLRNGTLVPSKPIMFHWIAAALAWPMGEFNVVMLRLPSALAGLGMALLSVYLGSTFGGALAGAAAGLMVISSEGLLAVATEGRVDSVFGFFVALAISVWLGALVTYAKQLPRVPERVYAAIAIITGCAVLTKGPLGLVLVGLVVGAVTLCEFGYKALWHLIRPSWLLALAIPLPWYIVSALRKSNEFVGRQIIYENLRRLTGGEGITPHPFLYYLPQLLAFAAPWSIAFGWMVFWWIKARKVSPLNHPTSTVAFGVRSCTVWLVAPLIFLTIASGKHGAYLMPLLPGLCIATALWLVRVVDWPRRIEFLEHWGYWIAGIIIGVGPLIVALSPYGKDLHRRAGLMARNVIPALESGWLNLVVVYGSLSFLTFWCIRTRHQREGALRQWGPPAIILSIIVFGVDLRVGRAVKGYTHNYRAMAELIKAEVPRDQPLHWVLRTGKMLGVGREDSFDGLFFYLRRHVIMRNSSKNWNDPGMYVARREWVDSQPEEWKRRVTERLTGGRLDDPPSQKLVLFELRG